MKKKIQLLFGKFLRQYNKFEIKKRECNLTFDEENFEYYYKKQKALINKTIKEIMKLSEGKKL